MLFAVTRGGVVSIWNLESERVTGYTTEMATETPGFLSQLFADPAVATTMLGGWDMNEDATAYRRWRGEVNKQDGTRRHLAFRYRMQPGLLLPEPHIWFIGLDITESLQAQRVQKTHEERLDLVVKAAKMGFWDWNAGTNEVYYSRECFELAGYDWQEFQPSYDKWLDLTHPQDRSLVANRVSECVNNICSEFSVEFRIRTKNGGYVWLFTQASASERDATGRATRIVGVVLDISARKRAEQDLKTALAKVEELKEALEEENLQLKQELQGTTFREEGGILSVSTAYKQVLQQVEQVAPTGTTVLILGETGTGKTLIANYIHRFGQRADKPLVKINCAALPENLIESELFGHEKGAFTGAYARKPGRFELADKGTIFLDEVGELPLELQAKLLRVLQDGEFEPLGGSQTRKVDVRVIAATNRDLAGLVKQGLFRADLFYRLNVFPIVNPPLRDRKEDIPLLVKHFVNRFNAKANKRVDVVPRRAMQALETYQWPGNIRELENIIERAVVLSTGNRLEIGDWFAGLSQRAEPTDETETSDDFETMEENERRHILAALRRTKGRVTGPQGAGRLLDINDKTLQSRMRKLGISRQHLFE